MIDRASRIARVPRTLATLLGAALAACGSPPPPAAPPPTRAPEVKVERVPETPEPRSDKTRGELALLIGPENEPVAFRDVRNVALAAGVSRVTLEGIPQDVEAGHVGVRSVDGKPGLELVELSAFSGVFTPAQLLAPSLGKPVTAYIWDPATGTEVARDATLVGLTDEGPVVAEGGHVRVLSFGRVAVPALPPALRAGASVDLTLRAQAATPKIELTYTSKLVKAALEYQLVRPAGGSTAELVGLVGIQNDTGAPLAQSTVTLTSDASEITKFASPQGTSPAPVTGTPTTSVTLPGLFSLGAGERSLTRLFGPRPVELSRKVVFEGVGLPVDNPPDEYGNASIHAVLDARVAGTEPLSPSGMVPGRAHLFERSQGAPPHAYGTAAARPLPGALGLRVDLGSESKYPSKRRLTQKRTVGRCVIETSWDVSFSNPTEESLPVEDVEPVTGKYELLESSIPPLAKETDNFSFALSIPPNGELHLKFKVRTSSCVVTRVHYWQPNWSKSSWDKPMMKGGS